LLDGALRCVGTTMKRLPRVLPPSLQWRFGFPTLSFQNPHRPPLNQNRWRTAQTCPQIPQGAQVPTQSSFLRVPRPLRATYKSSVTAAAEPGERPRAVRCCLRSRRISKNQPFATPRRRADRRRPKSEIEMIGRGYPGGTRWKTRSRASGGGPRETHGAAPHANARQPSQPAGCPAFPAYPQILSGFVRSRCPFAGTAKFVFAIRVARVSDVPVRNHKNTSLKAGLVPVALSFGHGSDRRRNRPGRIPAPAHLEARTALSARI